MPVSISRIVAANPLDIHFVASNHHGPCGSLILRPYYYAHTFTVDPVGLSGSLTADALLHFATGFASHARDHAPSGSFAPSGALFHVLADNDKMVRYMQSRDATTEPDTIIYHLDL